MEPTISKNGDQRGISGSDEEKRPMLARPIKIAANQHDSIIPSSTGRRNSPKLEIAGSSWVANICSFSHRAAIRTPARSSCFFSGCSGDGSMPGTCGLSCYHKSLQARFPRNHTMLFAYVQDWQHGTTCNGLRIPAHHDNITA